MKKGFTIIEMLLYISLLTIFISLMVTIFVTIMKSQVRSSIVSENEYDSRYIIQRMFYDFNNSTNLDTTIARYAVNNDILLLDGSALNSPDTKVTNFSLTKIGDTAQVKFSMNNKNYQSTFQLRP